ncbi:MAG: NAD(P)H-quinone oxidoreductase subunit 3 [Planctomycetales bacterium]|nr:NAD(P)H-quinone oxidoreductase subunit 3 [Planctomycetales bacterium]
MSTELVPVFLFVGCAGLLSVSLLVVGRLFGPRRSSPVKEMPYESGMDPLHDTHRRFDVKFHLVAIAFLIFDVELLFLYPWAVAARSAAGPPRGIDKAVEAGLVADRWLVFCGVMAFLIVLVLGFIYDWRKGVFRWR